MDAALRLAAEARDADEVPIGAVVVNWRVAASVAGTRLRWDTAIVGAGRNAVVSSRRVTAHAEMEALGAAAAAEGTQYCTDARLYVTLEPCVMCYGAALAYRIAALVYAAPSPKFGALSVCALHAPPTQLTHSLEVHRAPPTQVAAAADLMRSYFTGKRARNAERKAEAAGKEASSHT